MRRVRGFVAVTSIILLAITIATWVLSYCIQFDWILVRQSPGPSADRVRCSTYSLSLGAGVARVGAAWTVFPRGGSEALAPGVHFIRQRPSPVRGVDRLYSPEHLGPGVRFYAEESPSLHNWGIVKRIAGQGIFVAIPCTLVMVVVGGPWVFVGVRLLERRQERRRCRRLGICPACKYDLHGTVAAGRSECPECGEPIRAG